MTTEILTKSGFIRDENNFQLKEILKNNFKIKEIHIDLLPENPLAASAESFMLLLRTIEKNVVVLNDGSRLVIKKNDKHDTYLMNVLFSKITECYYKIFDGCFEFVLNIQNIYYRITVLN